MRNVSRATRALLALGQLTIGCGREPTAPVTDSSAGGGASTAVTVTTAPVAVSQQPVTIQATGSFTAAESSQVSPQVAGQVIATPVDVGDTVKAGDVIGRLDDRDA